MTTPLLYIFATIFGTIMGSFLNVVAVRDKKRLSILNDRSRCMKCDRVLTWYELIPLVSFILQGAKCRKCKTKISWQYPIVELIAAGLTVFAVWYGYIEQGSAVLAVSILLSFYILLVIAIIDAKTMEIPVEYTAVVAVFALLGYAFSDTLPLKDSLLGLVVGAVSIAIIVYGWKLLFHQDGMGDGDIFLAGALGAVVGYPLIFTVIMAASFVGAFVGIVVLAAKKAQMDTALPFGPFLVLGAVIALIWGQRIIEWYIL